MKKRPRAKHAPRSKPVRKPKGTKGQPKAKGDGKAKAPEKKAAVHPEPTEHGGPGKSELMYGGFTLRLYDHDKKGAPPAVYEGKLRDVIFPCDKPITMPAATSSGAGPAAGSCTIADGDTQLIAKLQRDLWSLGFWVFPREITGGVVEPVISGVFDWRTEWAVREFQIAAAMPNVAVQNLKKEPTEAECRTTGKYLSTLSAAKNECDFKGSPNGVLDAATRVALKFWLAKNKNYRCPLVIQAMKQVEVEPAPKRKKSKKTKAWVVDTENLWQYDEVAKKGPRMFAWDFSGHYDIPEGMPTTRALVGSYSPWKSYGGPRGSNTWDGARLKPESWHGNSWEKMSEPEKSTWRAIMAVAAQECTGGLDVINAWDNCLGSAGHFHWTMPKWQEAKKKKPACVGGGEYCGLMSYFEHKSPDAFKKCFSDFGIWGPCWDGSDSTESRKKVSASTTYTGYVYTKDDKGKFVRRPVGDDRTAFDETNWLRSWPWIYRLQMAARTCAEYRQATWDIAYQRVKNIRAMTCVDSWLPAKARNTTDAKLTIGDVITSERGMAVALRLHVRWSTALSAESKAGGIPILHDAIKHALADKTLKDSKGKALDWEIPAKDWTTIHELALVDAVVHFTGVHGKAGQVESVSNARFWPFRSAKGKLVTKEITVDKGTGKEKKLVPVLVDKNVGWVPKTLNPTSYGPKEAKGSFQPYG